jgi:uncharacterized protein (DUF302 family)
MKREIAVQHVSLELDTDFESFTTKIEELLGRFDHTLYGNLEADPRGVEERLKQAAGEEGLMLFSIQEHGKLLRIVGKSGKAKQYILGNPLIAVTMTKHDIRAALYAPLRMLAYENDGGALVVEFDQPSSLFGQFGNPEVTKVAESLDAKLLNVIRKAEQAAKELQSQISHRA